MTTNQDRTSSSVSGRGHSGHSDSGVLLRDDVAAWHKLLPSSHLQKHVNATPMRGNDFQGTEEKVPQFHLRFANSFWWVQELLACLVLRLGFV